MKEHQKSRDAKSRDAKSPLVSVIVTVYNGEGYLKTCLDALLSQSGVNLQIVAVDDGSTDASGRILDAYAAQHAALTVVHTENQGLGQARIEGLAKARGDYIGFCDSDDLPDSDMYATLLKRALETSADLVVCGFRRVDAASGRLIATEMLGFDPEPCLVRQDPGILLAVNTSVWNKLYRAELIDEDVLAFTFPRVAEDIPFELLVYRHLRRIAFVERPLYNYRVRTDSLMSGVTAESFECLRSSLVNVRKQIAALMQSAELLEVCDLIAFAHLDLSFPMRLARTEDCSLSQMIRHARTVLKTDFPLFASSRLCSLSSVFRHRGRNLKLSVARICQKLHLTTALITFLRFCLRHRWRMGYW
jgi:glycosyltransferase involved in cell wall biosynthesis